ncbi:hypothetical protein B842_02565 [Corynebacterium humireducens NBRC 106098 = DSM 45392]|uniref:N-acetyltransferase domain-containing protein n=1 Tax=Corynebacterium humireducens NBRC 106098 = DSM 45392 TaxID=1223515 RepID=A0A0B5D158_9CORY|nr:GNAT family N-acetyltransferase [Corynebacterium humireducens]AJE32366.1 hypothetical protein B842_02565 [Corynebacterium humireducens NBRC 106098 = DSM 45392]
MTPTPPGREADVILADGTVAVLRPVLPTDRPLFVEFYSHVSEESRYLRFFGPHPELTEQDLSDWVDVDGRDRVTLVLTRQGRIVATAHYALVPDAAPERVADVSFLVSDDTQGRGAANILLEHLAQVGRESGVTRFSAEMITSNQSMRQVFLRAGYDVRPALEDGVITVDFAIDPTERSRTVMHQREHRAEAASISALLTPAAIAVLGDSERMAPLTAAIRASGYPGRVDTHLRDPVDLVIAGYGPDLPDVIAGAARHGARGIVVLADGDNPNLSTAAAAALVSRARAHGIRACGPASLGLINTALPLNATPAPAVPAGRVGLFTQSAGVATLTLSRALERGCGLSSFVASGAFADVTANDLMQYWSDDPDTDICLLTLDAIGNPRKFFRVLRRLALEKPVVIFTPSRALLSARHHTAVGLVAVPPGALDEVIRHAGAIVTARRDTMFDVAGILDRQPVPPGRRVRVISNSAGLTAQMRQAAHRFGLHPSAVTVSGDPVEGLIRAARQALADPHVDIVLTAAVEISHPVSGPVHRGLEELAAACRRPLVGVFVGFGPPPVGADLPVFTSYADALEALALIADNEEKRAAARPDPADELAPSPEEDATGLLRGLLAAHPGGGWLSDSECGRLLAAYGIDTADTADTAGTAVTMRAVEDPVLGPIMSVGLAGPVPELLDDRSWRVPPLRRRDARDMLTGLGTAALLTGHDGAESADPADLAALEDLLMRLGRLKDELVSVVEVELSPVLAGPDGARVTGARARVLPLGPERDPLARSL